MRRVTLDEWWAEQEASDPSWARRAREEDRRHGPPRKVRLLVDENLGADFARYVTGIPGFRATAAPRGIEDEALWALARKRRLAILTADHDFWDDVRYPLQRCPGAIILVGSTAEAKAVALANLEHQLGLVRMCRMGRDSSLDLKVMARENGSSAKFWDGIDVVTSEL